jgi:hypothetical protein
MRMAGGAMAGFRPKKPATGSRQWPQWGNTCRFAVAGAQAAARRLRPFVGRAEPTGPADSGHLVALR